MIRAPSFQSDRILPQKSYNNGSSSILVPYGSENLLTSTSPTFSLVIETSNIDLGRVEINELKECYMTITNRASEECEYSILPRISDAGLIRLDTSWLLSSNETRRVDMSLMPFLKGQHCISCDVIDSKTGYSVVVAFAFYGILKAYLDFGLQNELDFGYCYVDSKKKYAAIRPLKFENISSDEIFVSAISNLSQQCFLFWYFNFYSSDASLENSVTEVRMLPNQTITIFVALQPHLVVAPSSQKKSEALVSDSSAHNKGEIQDVQAVKISSHEARNLIGGIKLNIFSKYHSIELPPRLTLKNIPTSSGLFHISTHTIKFNATIGQSSLSISPEIIDLGSITMRGESLAGGFWITNLNARMPLEFSLISSNHCLSLLFESGKIDVVYNGDSPDNSQSSRYWAEFTLKCPSFGFISESIDVLNNNNSAQSIRIIIRAFVDPQFIGITSWPLKSHGRITGKEASDLSHISWDNIFVLPYGNIGDRPLRLITQRKIIDSENEVSIFVHNRTDTVIHLQPLSNMKTTIKWRYLEGSHFLLEDIVDLTDPERISLQPLSGTSLSLSETFTICGPPVTIHPKDKIIATITLQEPDPIFDEQVIRSLISGERFDFTGTLLLETIDKNEIVKMIPLLASYYQSIGFVDSKVIDLGKVGHVNSWSESKFSFEIENLSETTLTYELDIPKFVILSSLSRSHTLKSRIPPKTSTIIDVIFIPRNASSLKTGAYTFNILIKNVYNPKNEMLIAVKYFMTEFELRFDRLVSGELVLPPLTHPSFKSSLPCDNWFTITNISEDDIKFDVGYNLTPDVAQLVSVDILSRVNAPIAGSIILSPKSVAEVKVRVTAIATARVFSKDLTAPEGITFGSLCILSKPAIYSNSESDLKITEVIPIRGIIVEGITFSLSRRHMEFKSFTNAGEEENVALLQDSGFKFQQSEDLIITNLSELFPFDFKVAFEYPIELSTTGATLFEISPVNEEFCGTVGPGDNFLLKVNFSDARIGDISQDIKLHVFDRNSFSRHFQTVIISVKEDTTELLATAIAPDVKSDQVIGIHFLKV